MLNLTSGVFWNNMTFKSIYWVFLYVNFLFLFLFFLFLSPPIHLRGYVCIWKLEANTEYLYQIPSYFLYFKISKSHSRYHPQNFRTKYFCGSPHLPISATPFLPCSPPPNFLFSFTTSVYFLLTQISPYHIILLYVDLLYKSLDSTHLHSFFGG